MPSSRKLANGGKSARSSTEATAAAAGSGAGGAAKKKRRRKAAVVVNTTNCKYEVVQDCADERGWRTTTDESGVAWNVYWTDTSVSAERCMALQSHQKINHFPGMVALSRKGGLGRALTRMQKTFPDAYKFFPETWVLPHEYSDFRAQFARKGTRTFIVKPDAGCQGKGIFLTRTWENVDPSEPQVAQRYLRKPLLIEGFKFDLRIYVLLLSIEPLRLYLYKDGLTRLCTEKYQEPNSRNLRRMCMHLTNYAINKQNDNFVYNKDAAFDGEGSKRSLIWFRTWLDEQGHDSQKVWFRIEEMIIKTVISVQPYLAHTYKSCLPSTTDGFSCFEILGLDVMLDHKLRPSLIEVNHSPSFNVDTPLDRHIKQGLITDTMDLINVHTYDRRKHKARESAAAQSRLYAGVVDARTRALSVAQARETAQDTAWAKCNKWERRHSGGFHRIFPVTPAAVEAGAKPTDFYSRFLYGAATLFEEGVGRKSSSLRPKSMSLRVSALLSGRDLARTAEANAAKDWASSTAPRPHASGGAGGGAGAGVGAGPAAAAVAVGLASTAADAGRRSGFTTAASGGAAAVAPSRRQLQRAGAAAAGAAGLHPQASHSARAVLQRHSSGKGPRHHRGRGSGASAGAGAHKSGGQSPGRRRSTEAAAAAHARRARASDGVARGSGASAVARMAAQQQQQATHAHTTHRRLSGHVSPRTHRAVAPRSARRHGERRSSRRGGGATSAPPDHPPSPRSGRRAKRGPSDGAPAVAGDRHDSAGSSNFAMWMEEQIRSPSDPPLPPRSRTAGAGDTELVPEQHSASGAHGAPRSRPGSGPRKLTLNTHGHGRMRPTPSPVAAAGPVPYVAMQNELAVAATSAAVSASSSTSDVRGIALTVTRASVTALGANASSNKSKPEVAATGSTQAPHRPPVGHDGRRSPRKPGVALIRSSVEFEGRE